jgi:NAD(P)-dependent dehydrogenase (short-subunit alcohol dehydrogenase family)
MLQKNAKYSALFFKAFAIFFNGRPGNPGPGPIETPIFERLGMRMTEEMKKHYASRTLMGRFGQSSEMSTAMKFLCSDEASYITGAILLADGGMNLVY